MSATEAAIDLPTGWINADKFELALQTGLKLTRRRLTRVTIRIRGHFKVCHTEGATLDKK